MSTMKFCREWWDTILPTPLNLSAASCDLHANDSYLIFSYVLYVCVCFGGSNNILYPKEDRERKVLLYACRNCDHQVCECLGFRVSEGFTFGHVARSTIMCVGCGGDWCELNLRYHGEMLFLWRIERKMTPLLPPGCIMVMMLHLRVGVSLCGIPKLEGPWRLLPPFKGEHLERMGADKPACTYLQSSPRASP